MCGGGGSSGGSTVTQVQQIPEWQEEMIKANEQVATSLASQPYQTYSGDLIAGFTPLQQQGIQATQNAANAYQTDLSKAENMTGQLANNQWNAQTANQYMSPYAMAALQPQIQQLQLQQGQQARDINARATQAGAFGDTQYGNAQALNNFYGNLAMNDLVSQGMNTAYNTGLGAYQTAQSQGLDQAKQMANLGGLQQQLGMTGAQGVFDMGTQQQQLEQQKLATAYQNFQNQVNWPYQQLNARIAATANSQYQLPTATLAPTSATASNLGAFASLAGGLGSLLGGNS